MSHAIITSDISVQIQGKTILHPTSISIKKGENVGLSFYAFFKNKNDNPKLLMDVAKWWIETHQFDHFEKAVKIRKMVRNNL